MISEPEMEGESDPAEGADLVSHTDRPSPLGRFTGKPWVWALGAVVVTSAAWAGVLRGTGYGHTAAPDLHGYSVAQSPCTNLHLQPLADGLGASVSFGQTTPLVTRSAALDRISCEFIGSVTNSDGWMTTYTISVTVDLHKKVDPTAEFDALSRSEVPAPSINLDLLLSYLDGHEKTTHPQGLGDRANLIAGDYRQSLYVLHGGAVFSLTLLGSNDWDPSRGKMPTTADGAATRLSVANTSAFRKDLAPTMRTLMRAMVQPPSAS